MATCRVPVVVERVTNISMGTELDTVTRDRVRGTGGAARAHGHRGRRPAGLAWAAAPLVGEAFGLG
jgi:hypothetical protein